MAEVKHDEIADFRRLHNPLVIDVRPQGNVAEVKRLLGTEIEVVAIPLADLFKRSASLSKDRITVTICRLVITSVKAADELVKLGFTDVHSLNGGVNKLTHS